MKHPLSWHQENLKNSLYYQQTLEKQLRQLQTQVQLTIKSNELRQKQIETAIAKGLREFDADKFLVQKTSKRNNL